MKNKQEPNLLERLGLKTPQNSIAFVITFAVMGITIYVAIFSLNNAPCKEDGSRDLSFIGQTLLPLWGTWIGTVLAYYFGKANFEAASKSYREVMRTAQTTEEKFAELAVKDVMLPVKEIVFLDYETELNNPVSSILKYPQFEAYNRFAVLDKNKVVKFMIHRGLFYQFIFSRQNELKPDELKPDTDKILLSELLTATDDRFKKPLTRGLGFVSVNSTLLDAKHVMDATEECVDVFVTQTGKPSEPVLGLLTNNRIFEHAKV